MHESSTTNGKENLTASMFYLIEDVSPFVSQFVGLYLRGWWKCCHYFLKWKHIYFGN